MGTVLFVQKWTKGTPIKCKGAKLEIVKIVGIGLIGLIIIIILRQYKPEFALYISLIIGVLVFFLVVDKLSGVINILSNLASNASINKEFIVILLKITGIALLTEFAVSVCKDSGEAAIASKIDFGAKVIMVSISIPIISTLLETILKILP